MLLLKFRVFVRLYQKRYPILNIVKDAHVSVWISASLADILSGVTDHQLKFIPSKSELLFIPVYSSPHQDLAISLNNSLISPLVTAYDLEVTMDNNLISLANILLMFHAHVDFNIGGICPFLSTLATQVFV